MKTRNEQGITHNLMLGVLGVLVLGAISFAGLRVYNNKSLKAQAAATVIGNSGPSGDIKVSACKTSVQSAYGPLWKVTAIFDKTKSKDRNMVGLGGQVLVSRNPGPNGATTVSDNKNYTWAYGGYLGVTGYASQLLNDRVALQVTKGNTNYGTSQLYRYMWDAHGILPAKLPTC